MKNSSYITGNRSRDHPACSAVPRPTAPPAACPPPLCPLSVQKLFNKYHAIRVRRAGITVSSKATLLDAIIILILPELPSNMEVPKWMQEFPYRCIDSYSAVYKI